VGSRKVNQVRPHKVLQFLSQMFKHDVADEGRNERNNEIRLRQDVVEGVRQRLALTVGDGEFAHEKVGIEEEDDECNLNHRAQKRLQESAAGGIRGHGVFMLSRIALHPDGKSPG